jgi:hypothetical protein
VAIHWLLLNWLRLPEQAEDLFVGIGEQKVVPRRSSPE